MFVGSVPRAVASTIVRSIDFSSWRAIFVCCSGSFRFEHALRSVFPKATIHSNDISLFSCSVGALLSGREFDLRFTNRIAFVEPLLAGRPFIARVAMVAVAMEIGIYQRDNPHARSHFSYYATHIEQVLADAIAKIERLRASIAVDSFFPGDFREHARAAIANGVGVVAFPPTYKGGYERLFRFVDQNTEWARPSYTVWDPRELGAWLAELDESGAPYCVVSDHAPDGFTPVAAYRHEGSRPLVTFSNCATPALRVSRPKSEPFRYRALEPAELRPESVVALRRVSEANMRFLKDVYLAKGIVAAAGGLSFLVAIDGALAGGFSYVKNPMHAIAGEAFLLLDFSLCPRSRVSKLIALIATSRTPLREFELHYLWPVQRVRTTVFTDKPVSMKYRGIFTVSHRKPGRIIYVSAAREQTPQELYRAFFNRYFAGGNHPRPAVRPCIARKERSLHGRPAIPTVG